MRPRASTKLAPGAAQDFPSTSTERIAARRSAAGGFFLAWVVPFGALPTHLEGTRNV